MTLLEVMMAVSILTVVMGAMFAISLSIGDTARVQEAQVVTNDQVRRGLETVVRDLRNAARGSINWANLPGEVITYRVAMDLDGNGTAVNSTGGIELSASRTICRDLEDANHDGVTDTQLVLISGEVVWVLASDLVPVTESTDASGVFGPAQDFNSNGRLDRGFWVEPRDNGLVVSLNAQGRSRRGHAIVAALREFVIPRN